MQRLGVLNMLIGFLVLTAAAAAGAFIATEATSAITRDPAILTSWGFILRKSAHAHTNLFGIIHILFGLTLPFSTLSVRVKVWQTVGLGCGTAAMSFGMMARSFLSPSMSFDVSEVAVGILLSLALLAIGGHAYGIGMKWLRS